VSEFQIITFYEFKRFDRDELLSLRTSLREAMKDLSIKGTIILAEEGFNSTVAGRAAEIQHFIQLVESILRTSLKIKSSTHTECPFRRVEVKIKAEIVTLKQKVDISKGAKTHVEPRQWNAIIADPETVVIDARNDYEYRTGTFRCAINPSTGKFSELPEFVQKNLDPRKHKRVAMFCTGGIRCEKFAPFMKQLGFAEVFQLDGGILKYLEEISAEDSLWEGECFVFDDRVTVDALLKKGIESDLSQTSK